MVWLGFPWVTILECLNLYGYNWWAYPTPGLAYVASPL